MDKLFAKKDDTVLSNFTKERSFEDKRLLRNGLVFNSHELLPLESGMSLTRRCYRVVYEAAIRKGVTKNRVLCA